MESDANTFEIPFPVLIGRDSDIIRLFGLSRLPQIYVIDIKGTVVFHDRFAEYETLVEIIQPLLEAMPHEEDNGSAEKKIQ